MRNTTSKATSATPQGFRIRANWLSCLCAVLLLLNSNHAQAGVVSVRYSVTTSSGKNSSLPKPAPPTSAPSLPKPSVISAPSLPKPIPDGSGPSLPKPQPQPKPPFPSQDSSEQPTSSLPKPGPADESPSLPKPTAGGTLPSLPKPTDETISLPKPEVNDEQPSLPKPAPGNSEPSLPKPKLNEEQSSLTEPQPVDEDLSGADQQPPAADQSEDFPDEDDTHVSPIDLVTPVTADTPLNPPESVVPNYDEGFEITYSPGSGSSQYPQFNFDPDDSDYDEDSPDSLYGIDHSPGDDFLYSDLYELDDISDDEYPTASWAGAASQYGATIPEPGTVILLTIALTAAALTRMRLRRSTGRRMSTGG